MSRHGCYVVLRFAAASLGSDFDVVYASVKLQHMVSTWHDFWCGGDLQCGANPFRRRGELSYGLANFSTSYYPPVGDELKGADIFRDTGTMEVGYGDRASTCPF